MSTSAYAAELQLVDSTLGAMFIGLVVSCMLFGVSSLQVYYYYHYYPYDGWLHKVSVGVLWVLDATHLSLTIYSSYYYGINGFGQFAVLDVVIWPVKLEVAINVVIILLVQSLYAYRVWILGGYHHGVLGYLVAGVVLGGFGIGIVLSYETYSVSNWTQISDIAWAVESSFAASTSIDIIISMAMCYYLWRSKGPESRLNSRISTLMQYTLSSGVFTSACSCSCLLTFIFRPNSLAFLALSYILTRLYMNSFMAMMNARQRVHRHNDSTFVLSSQSPSTSRPPRVLGDPESQRSQDNKFDWVDIPATTPTLSGGTYIPHLNGPAVYGSPTETYTKQW
ncbi:hypothetical protein MSAN_00424300 [Mycena sanguinolenta]|uniref:DUF6534 domain-containing protein n=1 Tax=Mycena sanguinolenta TaxID=230812 RepID=A0A8H6ZAL2_9AGAR|nr:hypothetical protein MSAN_00424300 [Mycena sanguinolenta]